VELHRAFGDIQFRGDFLIRETLKDAIQYFLLTAANLDACSKGPSGGQKFLSALRGGVQQRLLGNNHQFVIFGRLPSHQTMYGQ